MLVYLLLFQEKNYATKAHARVERSWHVAYIYIIWVLVLLCRLGRERLMQSTYMPLSKCGQNVNTVAINIY